MPHSSVRGGDVAGFDQTNDKHTRLYRVTELAKADVDIMCQMGVTVVEN